MSLNFNFQRSWALATSANSIVATLVLVFLSGHKMYKIAQVRFNFPRQHLKKSCINIILLFQEKRKAANGDGNEDTDHPQIIRMVSGNNEERSFSPLNQEEQSKNTPDLLSEQ